MPSTNYALTGPETTALDATLAGQPYASANTHVTMATSALTGLVSDALARAQARLDRLTAHQNQLVQSAYSDVLTARVPAVTIPAGSTISRQTITGTDTLVVTSP